MAGFQERVRLGRTELSVGPLAVSGGYGVDRASLLRAFDAGVNYWYHGSLPRPGMTAAIRELVAAGRRHELVVVLQSYMRWGFLMERRLHRELRLLRLDHADVLLLGWYNGTPNPGVLACAERMRRAGLVRHLAISGHHRPAFVDFARDPRYGALHIRYNAAHPGAEHDVFPQLAREDRPGVVAYTATAWGKLLRASKMPTGEAPLRARDCYRFVLSNPDFDVCMTGPKDAAQMDEALQTLRDGPMAADELARTRRIGAHVHG